VVKFDVYERPTFDKIIHKVADGGDSEDAVEAYAKGVCEKLELFEALSPSDAQKLGFLTYCQQSMNRYGNRRFQNMLEGYNMDSSKIDEVVRRLHVKLHVIGTTEDNGSVSQTFHAPMKALKTDDQEFVNSTESARILAGSVYFGFIKATSLYFPRKDTSILAGLLQYCRGFMTWFVEQKTCLLLIL
jgi:hypothetical protein